MLIRLYVPSTIGVFGPTTPRDNTPNHTVLEPETVYGISKVKLTNFLEYKLMILHL